MIDTFILSFWACRKKTARKNKVNFEIYDVAA